MLHFPNCFISTFLPWAFLLFFLVHNWRQPIRFIRKQTFLAHAILLKVFFLNNSKFNFPLCTNTICTGSMRTYVTRFLRGALLVLCSSIPLSVLLRFHIQSKVVWLVHLIILWTHRIPHMLIMLRHVINHALILLLLHFIYLIN